MGPVVSTDIAWLAGFFDGEGCISFNSHLVSGRGRRWVLKLVLANTHWPSVKRAAAMFPGLGCVHARMYRGKKWKPLLLWSVSSVQAELVLSALMPYLVAKRDEAELALEAVALRRSHRRRQANGQIAGFSDMAVSALTSIEYRLRGLKRVGYGR